MKSLKIILLSTCLIFATLCLSQHDKLVQSTKQQFEETDTDKNRIISLKEMINTFDELLNAGFDKDKLHKLTKQVFDKYDKDNNGLNWDEYLDMTVSKLQKQKSDAERKRLDPPELDSI